MQTKLKKEGGNIVAQSNTLLNAQYRLTRKEELLFSLAISRVPPDAKSIPMLDESAAYLAELFETDQTKALQEYDKTTTKFMSRVLKLKTEKGWKKFQWVSFCAVEEGRVKLKTHEELDKFILCLREQGNFTQYKIEEIVPFRSVYAIKFFKLMREADRKNQKSLIFLYEDLRNQMLGENSKFYEEFKYFKRDVINVVKKEFSEKIEKKYKSPYNFDLHIERKNRKAYRLEFVIIRQNSIIEVDENDTIIDSEILDILSKYGIGKREAKKIASQDFSKEYIQEKINLLTKKQSIKNIPNPAGWLLSAIKGDYKDSEKQRKEEVKRKGDKQNQRYQEKIESERREAIESSLKNIFINKTITEFSQKITVAEQKKFLENLRAGNPQMARFYKSVKSSKVRRLFLEKYCPNFESKEKDFIEKFRKTHKEKNLNEVEEEIKELEKSLKPFSEKPPKVRKKIDRESPEGKKRIYQLSQNFMVKRVNEYTENLSDAEKNSILIKLQQKHPETSYLIKSIEQDFVISEIAKTIPNYEAEKEKYIQENL